MSSTTKVKLVCNECGTKFRRSIGPYVVEMTCPKCHGVDTELA